MIRLRFQLRSGLMACFALAFALALLFQSFSQAATQPENAPGSFTERMAVEHQGDRPIASAAASLKPAQPVVSEEVPYATVEGQVVTGYLAQPVGVTEPLPGILAIHEWWGLNDNIRAMADRLAGEGYRVLAVDLYGGQVAEEPEQARQIMQSVMGNPALAQENLRQAHDYLAEQQNAPKVGSIGWCFGGAWSLQTGLLLPDQLDAMVIYYGRLVTEPAELAPLSMPIAGFFGGQDQGIPVAEVKAFEAALKEVGKSPEIHIYEEADHAFANPSGTRYNAEAAADAWEKTKEFLARSLT